VSIRISTRVYGHICNDVCPWNVKFARAATFPEFAPRELFAESHDREGTRALARSICMMDAADYAAAFKGSAIKRAKLWMLQRNACVALGNIGTEQDHAVLDAMCEHEHPLVREHARWGMEHMSRKAS
jgi:epoxyqueuosine reductase